jgi:hypothetical protein
MYRYGLPSHVAGRQPIVLHLQQWICGDSAHESAQQMRFLQLFTQQATQQADLIGGPISELVFSASMLAAPLLVRWVGQVGWKV